MESEHRESIFQYRILRRLGQGGMGEVFLAEDTTLNRRVALKFLAPDLKENSTFRGSLLKEARSAAAIDHPYICKIHEIVEASDACFIVMEYVEGETLRQKLSAGPIPLEEVLHIAIEIADALESAHKHGIIHRDLKPANIMVTSSQHVKIMDFGLARRFMASDADQTETLTAAPQAGSISGTLAYMSPEQVRNEPLDPRSDIFALGVVLYEMVAGVHPFQKHSPLETASAILRDSPPPVARTRKGVPRALENVLRKMLAKDRGQRHSSVREVFDDLSAVRLQTQSARLVLQAVVPVRSFRPALLLLLALLVLAGALAWAYRTFYHPQRALAFRARDWILIADFDNRTGDDVFNDSLHTALTVAIEQSRYVNVFPRSRMQDTLRRMGREKSGRIDEATAREIAVREGIKALLACSIARIGDTYSLTARLIDPNTQLTVLTEVSHPANKNGVLRGLDDTATRIRKRLGESLLGMAQPNLALPRATTASLEALKLFAASRQVISSDRRARDLLVQAVRLDPDFALAHADLGVDYYIGGDRVLGEEHFKKALSLLDRLTLREQLWIRAVVEDWRGNRDEAIGRYDSYLAQYPDSGDGWYRLGWARMITGRREQAIQAFQKVLEINPRASGAFVNIATSYGALHRYKEALTNYDKAFAIKPDERLGLYVNHEYGFVLVHTGELQRAEETFRKMLALDNNKKARGNRSLALLRMYQGKYKAAIPYLREAVLIDQASEAAISELRDRLYLASVYRTKGITAAFQNELRASRQIHARTAMAPDFSVPLGVMCAREGNLREAGMILQDVEKRLHDIGAASGVNRDTRRDQVSFDRLRGEIELARSKSPRAAEILEVAYRLYPDELILESLAHAYWKLGKLDDASIKYQELLANQHLGDERQEPWIMAHLHLGKIFQQKGDIGKARQYYEKFLEIWKDADPDLPPIVEARKQLDHARTGRSSVAASRSPH